MSPLRRQPGTPTAIEADCFDCLEREQSAWCGLAGTDLHTLNRIKQCTLYPAGHTVHLQDETCGQLLIVQAGAVAVRKTDRAGRSVFLRLCYTGDSLGYRELLTGQKHTSSAEALVDSTVCRFEREPVMEVLERNPALGERFLRRISEQLETAETDLLRTATLPVRRRVAHLLLSLKDRFGIVNEGGAIALLLPLTQQDIASLLGVQRETIARTLHALERGGVIRLMGHGILIPGLDSLLDEAEKPGR